MRFVNKISWRTGRDTRNGSYIVRPVTRPVPKLRERFTFLDDPECPVELQALVTRRISDYHQYSRLYLQLRECETIEQCADIAEKLLDAYLDNQAIFRELEFYQKHRKVLGHHPLFRHFQELTHLRSMSVRDLIREQTKTKDNIWRVKSEMAKGDKPHLDEKRRMKLQQHELKLQEINRLLGE